MRILVFVFLLIGVSLAWEMCWQESATVSDQGGIDGSCGQQYTGAYSVSNSGSWTNPTNTYDGNWGTSGKPPQGGTEYIYINYTKPSGYTVHADTLWNVSGEYSADIQFHYNYTLGSSCIGAHASLVELRIRFETSSGYDTTNMECWNGGGWTTLGTETMGNKKTVDFFEEGLNWNVTQIVSNYVTAYALSPSGTEYNNAPTDVEFSFRCDGTEDSYYVNITTNDTYTATEIPADNNTVTYYNITDIDAGAYSWYVTCYNDSVSIEDDSSTLYFDVTNGTVSANTITPDDALYNNAPVNVTFTFNCTGSSPSYLANLSINGTTNISDISLNNDTNTQRIIEFGAGAYSWELTCWNESDSAYDTSASKYFNVSAPWVDAVATSPDDDIYINAPVDINFTLNCYGSSPSYHANISINGTVNITGITVVNNTPVTQQIDGFIAGAYSWTATCWNSTHGSSDTSDTMYFNVTDAMVTATAISPDDQTFYGPPMNITFTFDCTGSLGSYYANLSINGSVNVSGIAAANGSTIEQNISFTDTGPYDWDVVCWNGTTYDQSDTLYFNISYSADYVTANAISPNGTIFYDTGTNVTFTFNCSGSMGSYYANVTTNGSANWTNLIVSNNTNHQVDASFANGLYVWNVTCWNSSGLPSGVEDYSDTLDFTMGDTPPVVTLLYPSDGSHTSSTVIFGYRPSDTSGGLLSCSIYLNGTLNTTNTSIANGTVMDVPITGLNATAWEWYVNCTDSGGLDNQSGNWTFYVVYSIDPCDTECDEAGGGGCIRGQVVVYFGLLGLIGLIIYQDRKRKEEDEMEKRGDRT